MEHKREFYRTLDQNAKVRLVNDAQVKGNFCPSMSLEVLQ